MPGPTLSNGLVIGRSTAFGLQSPAASAGATDQYFSSVSLLATFQGTNGATTFTDSSPIGHTLTANGDAKLTTSQAPTGQTSSLITDGTGDFVSIPDHASLEFGSGDFTIEFWVRFASVAGGQTIMSKRAGTSGWGSFIINMAEANTVRVYMSETLASAAILNGVIVDAAATTGVWTHYFIGRSGNTFYGAKNGTIATLGTSALSVYDGTESVRIGAESNGAGTNGFFSSVRITKGVCRYTANFTPPTLPLPTS